MIYCLIQRIDKFEEILFVQEDFVLFIAEVITVCSSLALRNGQVIIVTTG